MAKSNQQLKLAESIIQDCPKVTADIVDIGELEEMSLADITREKHYLEARRKKAQLRIDQGKIDQSIEIVCAMQKILGRITDYYNGEYVSAKDMRDLAAAYLDMNKALNMVTRLDSIDGTGKAARFYGIIEYES